MFYGNLHGITKAMPYEGDEYSSVRLFIRDDITSTLTLFFKPGKAEAVAAAINAAIAVEEVAA
jgi:hypothetical protein